MAKTKAKTASEMVQDSQAKTLEAGGARLTLLLSPAEAADWRKLLKRYPGRGGQKAAFIAGVRSLLNEPEWTDRQLVAVLKRRLGIREIV